MKDLVSVVLLAIIALLASALIWDLKTVSVATHSRACYVARDAMQADGWTLRDSLVFANDLVCPTELDLPVGAELVP